MERGVTLACWLGSIVAGAPVGVKEGVCVSVLVLVGVAVGVGVSVEEIVAVDVADAGSSVGSAATVGRTATGACLRLNHTISTIKLATMSAPMNPALRTETRPLIFTAYTAQCRPPA